MRVELAGVEASWVGVGGHGCKSSVLIGKGGGAMVD